MKLMTLKLLWLPLVAFISGCATPATENFVSFKVTSDPPGCPIEVNGVSKGKTPTTIQLGLSKHWVGLAYASDGWGYGNEAYTVTCFPPPDSNENLTSQTKRIRPSMTPKGADIYFNLRLRHVTPNQSIEVKQSGKSEVLIKEDAPDDPIAKKLRSLKALKDEGLISQDEYEMKRNEILNQL